MKSLLGILFILITSCTDIFKTELPSIKNCTDEDESCSYTESIQPIFNLNCTRCHGDLGRTDGGLDLTSYSSLMSGGNSGQIIIEGESENSLLWKRITNSNSPMPPAYDNPMLDDIYKNIIAKWIEDGAKNN